MAGVAKGPFPSFLPKTDEANFQTVDFEALLKSEPFYITEKADGSSCTAWMDEQGLHVASRNWELLEFDEEGKSNAYWKCARSYLLENMPLGLAVQFELVGPGIQSNPMGLTQLEGRMFGAFRRESQVAWRRLRIEEFPNIGLPLAKQVPFSPMQLANADALRALAEIKYATGKPAEGIVIRANDQSWSFKVLSLLYKD